MCKVLEFRAKTNEVINNVTDEIIDTNIDNKKLIEEYFTLSQQLFVCSLKLSKQYDNVSDEYKDITISADAIAKVLYKIVIE